MRNTKSAHSKPAKNHFVGFFLCKGHNRFRKEVQIWLPLANLANRGSALEDLVARANDSYRSRRIAVIHKVPTAWLPIRGPSGKIISAKVDKKASVDFIGHVLLPTGSLPVAFDVKEVSKGFRWPLSRLEEHQYKYLRDSALTGAFSFVLIGFWESQRFFILPFAELEARWLAWKAGTGPASVKAGENGLIETCFMDYFGFLRRKELL